MKTGSYYWARFKTDADWEIVFVADPEEVQVIGDEITYAASDFEFGAEVVR